jgi:hypothetical protein
MLFVFYLKKKKTNDAMLAIAIAWLKILPINMMVGKIMG